MRTGDESYAGGDCTGTAVYSDDLKNPIVRSNFNHIDELVCPNAAARAGVRASPRRAIWTRWTGTGFGRAGSWGYPETFRRDN